MRPDEHKERLSRIRREADFPLTYYLINPINRRLVGPVARLGISPNAVTFASFLVSAMGSVVLYFAVQGVRYAAFLAPFLVFLGHVLDTLDGDLARYVDRRSVWGEALDPVLDRVVEWLLILGVTGGLFRVEPEAIYWIVGASAAAGDLIYYYTTDAHLSRLMKAEPNEARRYLFRRGQTGETQLKFGLYELMKYALGLGPCIGLAFETLVFVVVGYWSGLIFQLGKLYRVSSKRSEK